MAPHFSTLAWNIPWTEEPGRLQSMGVTKTKWLNNNNIQKDEDDCDMTKWLNNNIQKDEDDCESVWNHSKNIFWVSSTLRIKEWE